MCKILATPAVRRNLIRHALECIGASLDEYDQTYPAQCLHHAREYLDRYMELTFPPPPLPNQEATPNAQSEKPPLPSALPPEGKQHTVCPYDDIYFT